MGEICRFHHEFFCFSPWPAATKMQSIRLNRLRSAIQYVSQAQFSKPSVQQVQSEKKKKGRGLLTEGHRLLLRLGTGAGVLGAQPPQSPQSLHVRHWEQLSSLGPFFLSVFTLVLPLPFPAATGFYLHCSLKPGSQCAARPSTRSAASQQLPPKLQCIITTSCSGLWAGPLCKQASRYPRFHGGDSPLLAAANSPKEVPTPWEGAGAALPSLSWLPEASAQSGLPSSPHPTERVVFILSRKVPALSPAAALALRVNCLC